MKINQIIFFQYIYIYLKKIKIQIINYNNKDENYIKNAIYI